MRRAVQYMLAGALRYWLVHSPYWELVVNRVEVATPLNAWRRLVEGATLYERGIDPYTGDAFHESPLLLVVFHALLTRLPHLAPLAFTVLDLLTAFLLYKTSTGFAASLKESQKKNEGEVIEESKFMLLTDAELEQASEYVAAVYLFNPYSVLNCVGMTSTVLNNTMLAGALCGAVHGWRVACVASIALATHQALYPALLIVPAAILIAEAKGGCAKCSHLRTLLAFVLFWAFLIWVSALIMGGSYSYVHNTYGFILTVPDLKPNIGLFWYFFTEMFEHFRLLFICAFQINALALYVVPLTLRFHREPMLLATTLIALTAIFRPYPCVGDVGFYLALFPMWRHLFSYMQQKFIVGCTFVIASALGPAVWHLWIYSRSANANFFFGVTLSFATAQIFLITDLLFAYIKREFTLKHGSSRLVDATECELLSSIPVHLLECYRSGAVGAGPTAPRRLDVFLQILRKLESHRSQLDLRMFSSALLRSLRLDGIEQSANSVETDFLTPFRATAFQFQRYKLLMDLFLPAQNLANIEEDLTAEEKCSFHRMLSSTVQRWERGDESAICPLSIQERQNAVLQRDVYTGRAYSRCPIEEGVIQTDWGTISPGTVVAAIATAMESERVSMTDLLATDSLKSTIEAREDFPDDVLDDIETLNEVIAMPRIANAEINNVFVAALAGDLAEVAVNQGPRVGAVAQNISIGSNNRWNDTLLPRLYYMFPQNETAVQWHMTDAEILAGVDGLIIAKELHKWTAQLGSVRLSQILDMYYSHTGVSFDINIKACNRQANFFKIFDQDELLKEMSNFAQLLALTQGTVYVPTDEVDRICRVVATAFVTYLSDVLSRNQQHCRGDVRAPAVDLLLVTDAAWKRYQGEQFLSSIGRSADVSSGRSSLGYLHGNTGAWIASPANNLTALFRDIHNFTSEWPNRLNFATVLTSLTGHLANQTLAESASLASVALPTLVLVASPGDRLTSADLELSRDVMSALRRNHFDVHFAYLAQDLTSFYELNVGMEEFADLYLQVESTSVAEAARRFDEEFARADIPKRVIGRHCTNESATAPAAAQTPHEDSVLVNQKITYRIHPYYLHDTQLVTVTFRTMSEGEVRVCSTRDRGEGELSCHQLGQRESATFNLTRPCERSTLCGPAYFTVTGVSALNTCANTDCRSPSQIGFYVEHAGLRCLSLNKAVTWSNGQQFLIYLIVHYLVFQLVNL